MRYFSEPYVRMAVWILAVVLVGLLVRDFWPMLIVAAVGFADLRQAVRRHNRR